MAKGLINDSTLTAIADAIRAKNGSEDTMLPSEMAGLIEAIESGGVEAYMGTVSGGLNSSYRPHVVSVSLGTVLPESENYLFVIFGDSTYNNSYVLTVHTIYKNGGETLSSRYFVRYKSSSSTSINTGESDTGLELSTGIYSTPNKSPYLYGKYYWFYFVL